MFVVDIFQDLNKNGYDAYTVEHCLNAVEWACRMLPFCRFMNAEELVQDVILSLLGELPPVEKVEDLKIRVKAIEMITSICPPWKTYQLDFLMVQVLCEKNK